MFYMFVWFIYFVFLFEVKAVDQCWESIVDQENSVRPDTDTNAVKCYTYSSNLSWEYDTLKCCLRKPLANCTTSLKVTSTKNYPVSVTSPLCYKATICPINQIHVIMKQHCRYSTNVLYEEKRKFGEEDSLYQPLYSGSLEAGPRNVTIRYKTDSCRILVQIKLNDKSGKTIQSKLVNCSSYKEDYEKCFRYHERFYHERSFENLQPFAEYSIVLRQKLYMSKFWSDPVSYDFKTAEDLPTKGPKLPPGLVFLEKKLNSCHEISDPFNVSIIWRAMTNQQETNGEILGYRFRARFLDSDKIINETDTNGTILTISFNTALHPNWCERRIFIEVWALNSAGQSIESSRSEFKIRDLIRRGNNIKVLTIGQSKLKFENLPEDTTTITLYYFKETDIKWKSFWNNQELSTGKFQLVGYSAEVYQNKSRLARSVANDKPVLLATTGILPIIWSADEKIKMKTPTGLITLIVFAVCLAIVLIPSSLLLIRRLRQPRRKVPAPIPEPLPFPDPIFHYPLPYKTNHDDSNYQTLGLMSSQQRLSSSTSPVNSSGYGEGSNNFDDMYNLPKYVVPTEKTLFRPGSSMRRSPRQVSLSSQDSSSQSNSVFGHEDHIVTAGSQADYNGYCPVEIVITDFEECPTDGSPADAMVGYQQENQHLLQNGYTPIPIR